MKPSVLLDEYRSEICRMVELNHVQNPRVFGSVSRGDDAEDSDLDLLGVPVDVLTLGDLPPKFREAVLREAVPV